MKEKFINTFMKVAYLFAELSYCKRRKVGCVVVKNNSIISIGYNGTPSGEPNECEDEQGLTKTEVVHAEDNALRKLTRSHETAQGSSVFVTTAPCVLCATRIVDAGVTEVYYDEVYRNTDGLDYLNKHGIKTIHLKGQGDE